MSYLMSFHPHQGIFVSRILLFALGSITCFSCGNASHADEPTKEQSEFFEKKIRPILNDKCFECHAAEKQESDLRLDSRESIIMGGASGSAVDLEDAESSLLLEVLNYGGDIEMPPDQKLDDEVIDSFKEWIEMGLPWPKSKKDNDSSVPLTMAERVNQHRSSHWAYQPVKVPTVEIHEQDNWSRTTLDRLIWNRLHQNKLAPSQEADRYTLTRRLYLVLLGVPPTYEEVQAVQNDNSPNWYSGLVERLLASPRYGERWGRHWLDVARYADTRGYSFQRDRNYPHAYTYRDYVVQSFNEDKPYDRFVHEQLAADYLELGDDLTPLAGLGFLTVGRKFNNIHDDVDDKIDVVFRGLQGLTVSCARCHDHKYDAIPTADYYSLYGVFISAKEGPLPYIGSKSEVDSFQQKKSKFDAQKRQLDDFLNKQRNEIVDQARMNPTVYFAKVLGFDDSAIQEKMSKQEATEYIPKIARAWRDYIRGKTRGSHPVWLPWQKFSALKDDENFGGAAERIVRQWQESKAKINATILKEIKVQPPKNRFDIARIYGKVFQGVYVAWKKAGANDSGLAKLSESERQIGIALFTDRTPTEIKTNNITAYFSGNSQKRYEELKAAVEIEKKNLPPELDRAMVVSDISNPVEPFVFIRGQAGRRGKKVPRQFVEILSEETRKPFSVGSGRHEIAQNIVDPANPLTSRVFANRIWMHLMGQSLVATPSDFGTRCEEPVQKDVLDLLATELIQKDWSIKSLQRTIVMSSAFRQSSKHRAHGHDKDVSNSLYWRANRQRLEFEPLRDSMLSVSGELDLKMGGKSVPTTKKPFAKRRAVYGYIDRQDLPNLLRAFDFASPDQSTAQRTQTTVPQQMLFMMNSPFVIERAFKIAQSIPADLQKADKVVHLYRQVLAREPNDRERAIGTRFLQSEQANDNSLRNLAQIILLTNEFTFVD